MRTTAPRKNVRSAIRVSTGLESAGAGGRVIFRVADVNRVVGVDVDAMGAGEFTIVRRAVRAITLLSRAGDEVEVSGRDVDHADRVRLGVDEINVVVRTDRDAFRAGQGGKFRRAPVPGEARLAGAGEVAHRALSHVEPVDRVAFAEREDHVAVAAEIDRARAVEG